MGIPLPALSVQAPPAPEDPIQRQAKLVSLANMMQQQKMGQIQLQQAQIQMEDQQKLRQAMSDPSINWRSPDAYDQLYQKAAQMGVSPTTLQPLQQHFIQMKRGVAELTTEQLAQEKVKNDYFAQAIDNVKSLPVEQQPAAFERAKGIAVQRGYLDPNQAQQIQYQGPEALGILENSLLGHAAVTEDALKKQQMASAKATEDYRMAQQKNLGKGQPSSDIKNYEFAKSQGYAGTFEQWQKDEANRKPRAQSTVVVQTVDANGNPVTRIVPKTAGSEFAKPNAAEQAYERGQGSQAAKDAALYQDAQFRLGSMQESAQRAKQGDQQAMLNILANHIGMTLGLQKGARITRAVWEEAMQSAPWISRLTAKFDNRGYLSGVVLTPGQIDQMMQLANTQASLAKKRADFSRAAIGGNSVPSGPRVGDVEGGYRFNGGDPSQQQNWEKVR